jgi:putative FmdB family regulatory protein
MPIFEYKCQDCNTKFEVLHKSSTHLSDVFCPNCKSANSKKLFSKFNASMNESSDSSYNDSCASGSCDLPSGGCSTGMCGLN